MSTVKVLPSAPEVEADVLGACIADGSKGGVYWRTLEQMGGDGAIDLFHKLENRIVATALLAVSQQGKPLTIAAISDELARDAASDRLAPSAHAFIQQMHITSNIRDRDTLRKSVNVLIEHRASRRTLTRLEELAEDISTGSVSGNTVSGELRDIALGGGVVEEIPILGELIAKLENEDALGVAWRSPTGVTALDKVLNGGYEPRRLMIIGARPKVGKSMLLFNAALEALSMGAVVLFASLELSDKELWTRMMSSYAMIPQRDLQDIQDGKKSLHDLTEDQISEYNFARKQLGRAQIHSMFVRDIKDGVDSIVSAAISLRMKYGEDRPIVVFVDYIQLLVKDSMRKREEIEDASRKLKRLALEFDLSVIAAAQVNRASASNGEDGMPRAYMLRDSGSLEQDADVVMMINRPHLQDETESPDLMHIFVELNRVGPSQQWVDARFMPEFQRVTDMNVDDIEDENGDPIDQPRENTSRPSRDQDDSADPFSGDEEDNDFGLDEVLAVTGGSSSRRERRERSDSDSERPTRVRHSRSRETVTEDTY